MLPAQCRGQHHWREGIPAATKRAGRWLCFSLFSEGNRSTTVHSLSVAAVRVRGMFGNLLQGTEKRKKKKKKNGVTCTVNSRV